VLSNLPEMLREGLGSYNKTAWDAWVASASAPAIPGALELHELLHEKGYSVAFITGRPEEQRAPTEEALKAAGFGAQCGGGLEEACGKGAGCYVELVLRSTPEEKAQPASVYKPARRGYLADKYGVQFAGLFGDQWSDLSGTDGPADDQALFKLPNPFYYVA